MSEQQQQPGGGVLCDGTPVGQYPATAATVAKLKLGARYTFAVAAVDALGYVWAKARKVTVLPRFNCQSTAVLHRILTEPVLREQWLQEMAAISARHGYDGVTLDFEAGAAADRDAYSAFVTELASRLHAQGRQLMLAVSAKTADVPGPSPLDVLRLRQAVGGSRPRLRGGVGHPLGDFGAWRAGRPGVGGQGGAGGGTASPAVAYEYGDVMDLVSRLSLTPRLDLAQDALVFAYTDSNGASRDAWYTDATTQAQRIDVAKAGGMGGVGFWRLGREDQRLWDNPALAPGAAW